MKWKVSLILGFRSYLPFSFSVKVTKRLSGRSLNHLRLNKFYVMNGYPYCYAFKEARKVRTPFSAIPESVLDNYHTQKKKKKKKERVYSLTLNVEEAGFSKQYPK